MAASHFGGGHFASQHFASQHFGPVAGVAEEPAEDPFLSSGRRSVRETQFRYREGVLDDRDILDLVQIMQLSRIGKPK